MMTDKERLRDIRGGCRGSALGRRPGRRVRNGVGRKRGASKLRRGTAVRAYTTCALRQRRLSGRHSQWRQV